MRQRKQLYASQRTCSHEGRRMMPVRSHVHRCEHCGKPHSGPRYKFCSGTCAVDSVNARRRAVRPRPVYSTRECINPLCRKQFVPTHGLQTACSNDCCPSVVQRKRDGNQDRKMRVRRKRFANILNKHSTTPASLATIANARSATC